MIIGETGAYGRPRPRGDAGFKNRMCSQINEEQHVLGSALMVRALLEVSLMPRFITIKSFCMEFQVGRTRAYALIAAGAIEAVKNGSRTLIVRESAERWAASLPRMVAKKT